MYRVIAKLDKQNRVTIPQVVRELIGVGPEDVIEFEVIGKVQKAKNEESLNPQMPVQTLESSILALA